MKQSELFFHTLKDAPADEESVNAQYLIRGCYIEKLMSGVYTFLPLGWRVFNKITNIIREELNAIGGQELFMPALQPKELWDETGRWEDMNEVMFQFKGRGNREIGLAATHEETITDIVRKRVNSYKDLPFSMYQIQTKFRNEPRAKSGILRGREFFMKDLYSFHATEKDLNTFYDAVKEAYLKIFTRCGLDAKIVEASGGVFSKEYSHEFQVEVESGEDTIYNCKACGLQRNKELIEEGSETCPECSKKLTPWSGVEVGNIFKLGTRFSDSMGATFTDKDGNKKPIIEASYGIGPSRVMGTIVEVHYDKDGIIWPKEVAPFQVHVLIVGENKEVVDEAQKVYNDLLGIGLEVLLDNRDKRPGEKLKEADLLGIPVRIVVSPKTLEKGMVEVKERAKQKETLIELNAITAHINETLQ